MKRKRGRGGREYKGECGLVGSSPLEFGLPVRFLKWNVKMCAVHSNSCLINEWLVVTIYVLDLDVIIIIICIFQLLIANYRVQPIGFRFFPL